MASSSGGRVSKLGLAITIIYAIVLLGLGAACMGVSVRTYLRYKFAFGIADVLDIVISAAVFTVMVGGILLMVFAFLGPCAMYLERKGLVYTTFALQFLVALLLIVGGILAGVSKIQVKTDEMPEQRIMLMDFVRDYYGINPYDRWYAGFTSNWNALQLDFVCCGVDANGWQIYKGSKWYESQEGLEEVDKPLVPESCCVKDQFGEFEWLDKCQNWARGPPNIQTGERNEAVAYRGCLDAMREFVDHHSGYFVGLGICSGLITIFGIVVMIVLFSCHKETDVKKPQVY